MHTINNWNLAVMRTILAALGLLGFYATPLSALAQDTTPETSRVLLENLRVIVGDGRVLENVSVLIVGDTISEVATNIEQSLPAETVRLDLTGKTMMPALIDVHAHLGYDSATSWGAQNYGLENLIDNLNRYAYYGFSAVFSAGSDPDDLALELQNLQQRGEVGGARFLFAAGMAPPGQGPNNQFLVQALNVEQETGMTILRGLGDPQQARAAVHEVAAKGIRFIKIWVDDRAGSQLKLQPETYRAVIDEANASGIAVFVHQQFASDMPDLIDAGVRGFLHGRIENNFSLELAQSLQTSEVFVVPNLGLGELRREAIAVDPFLSQILPPAVAGRMSVSAQRSISPATDADLEQALRNGFDNLLRANVNVVLGTDAGAVPDHPFGYTGHRELEIFVRLGMTPLQAISTGTSAAASALGLEDSLGLITPGYSADFILLDRDPLQDIRNSRSINQVYLRGQPIDREALAASFSSAN